MGTYFIFAALSFQERTHRANVVPITLGPHGSNFADVVDALKSLRPLDAGVEVELRPGENVLLCAFTMAYIGDNHGNLGYNTFENGRYHKQAVAMRDDMKALRLRCCETSTQQNGASILKNLAL